MQIIDKELKPELLKILNNFLDFHNNLKFDTKWLKGNADSSDYHVSQEFLDTLDANKHIGYPEYSYGFDYSMQNVLEGKEAEFVRNTTSKLNAYFGSRNCAVIMYYPKDGYMSWHTNHNADGYNILISHTATGNGFFRYCDPITKEIVTVWDRPGWMAKVGYFGKLHEPDKIFWHCARTYEPRITFGFVIPHKEMWEDMVEDL